MIYMLSLHYSYLIINSISHAQDSNAYQFHKIVHSNLFEGQYHSILKNLTANITRMRKFLILLTSVSVKIKQK